MRYRSDRLLNAKPRAWELDFLRGFAIILMLFDHLLFDFSILPYFFVNGYDMPEFMESIWELGLVFMNSTFREVGHYLFAALFLLITGISCAMSRSNLGRGIRLAAFSMLLTFSTAIIDGVMDMGVLIIFGVIHCMSVAILLVALLEKVTKRDIWLLIFGVTIILGGFAMPWYEAEFIGHIPSGTDGILTVLDIVVGTLRFGGDHFPIFPCAGITLVGAYLGKKFYRDRRSLYPRLDGSWNRGFCAVGRHTVWIYLLHQPLVIAFVIILGLCFGLEVF